MAKLRTKKVNISNPDDETTIDEELMEEGQDEEDVEEVETTEDLEDDPEEVETVTMIHTIKEGTLCTPSNRYDIVDHTVEVLPEDVQDCLLHGLVIKG